MRRTIVPQHVTRVLATIGAALGFSICLRASEVSVADELRVMQCQVDLSVADGEVVVDRIRTGQVPSERLFALLKHLTALRSLSLHVRAEEGDRTCLQRIGSLGSLRELSLAGDGVNDEVMTWIGCLTNLQQLSLWRVSVGSLGLSQLRRLQLLKRFDFSTFETINRLGAQGIARLLALEEVRIAGPCEAGALSVLATLPNLRAICLSGVNINGTLSDLNSVLTIERVEISMSAVDLTTTRELAGMKNLSFLKLECCNITQEAVPGLASLALQEFECTFAEPERLGELARALSRNPYRTLRVLR